VGVVFKRGYFGFYRPGDYYVVGAELRSKNQPVQFRIKLPLAHEELQALGHEIEKPDVSAAVDLTSRYQPASGHMPTPSV
jgi:hypothetical protein